MSHDAHARARLFANLLTCFIAAYGAWGYVTDPQLSLMERLAGAAIALVTQQLANEAGAHAAMAARQNMRVAAAVGILLVALFGGVSGHAIEHAISRPAAAREASELVARADERARLLAEIRAATDERHAAEASLRAIPTDIPTRRIQALQAPLNEAIRRSARRVAELEAARAALEIAPAAERDPQSTALSLLFWLLAFGEPGFYWLLASVGERAGVPAVPQVRPKAGTACPGMRAGGRPAWSQGFLGRIALAVGLTTASAAQAADSGDSVAQIIGTQELSGTFREGTPPPDAGTTIEQVAHKDAALCAAAQALRERGFSYRAIARTLGQRSKSEFHRMLRGAQVASPTQAPDCEHP
jgi:hypothetical protein